MRRRWLLFGAAAGGGLLFATVVGFFACYGRLVAGAVRTRALPEVAARLGRDVSVETIDADRERIVLRGVVVRGPRDGAEPLLVADAVVVPYRFWAAVGGDLRMGAVELVAPRVTVTRGEDGADNVSDLLARVRGEAGEGGERGGGGRGGRGPTAVAITDGTLSVDDRTQGARLVAGFSTKLVPGESVELSLRDVAVQALGVTARAARIVLSADPTRLTTTATATIEGGALRLWKGMSLTGIAGTIRPEGASRDSATRATLDLAGGYGGVEGTLWTAKGWLEPDSISGSLDLRAERFTFGRLRPILEGSMVQDFEDTAVDLAASVSVDHAVGVFSATLDVRGLSVFHPALADQPLRDLSFEADVAGGFDLGARTAELTRGVFEYRGVGAQLTAFLRLPGGVDPDTGFARDEPRVGGRLVVPTVPCQEVLDALPPELTPHLQGFALRGNFDAEVILDIDWQDLPATVLTGDVDLRRCKVDEVPEAVDAERFRASFVQTVPDLPGEFRSIEIGPENPDFVPLAEISPHVVNAILTREDSRFYDHHGFIPSEFDDALIRNLQAGYFRYGASSISMQTTKNLLLYRDKLLARKLQELFLTWYLESELDKDRILEIYLNAIEYGPGIYGIGPAARAYFDKLPAELSPTEAAWLAVILPAPKPRYAYYCTDQLSRTLLYRIPRTLDTMVERGRLSVAERMMADVFPLTFHYPDDFSEKACLERLKTFMPEQAPDDIDDEE